MTAARDIIPRHRHALIGVTAFALAVWLIDRLARRRQGSRSKLYLELRVATGAAKGAVYQFKQSESVTVGRRATNTICLADTGVSGGHFEVAYNASGSQWEVTDMGSLNGTFLNGVNIGMPSQAHGDPHALSAGDQIRIGELTVVEVTCVPSATKSKASSTGPSRGDTIAQDLLRRVRERGAEQAPTAPSLRVQSFCFDEVRAVGCSVQQQGSRARGKACEDTFSHSQPVPGLPLFVLCLCDGHCGDSTSNRIQQLLPGVLAKQIHASGPARVEDLQLDDFLRHTFLKMDELVEGEDGSTMTLVVLFSDGADGVRVQSANVGDSAVVCADFAKMMKMHLTENHRVTHAGEQQRLRETRSLLTHNGTRVMGLNLSRSIGDKALKEMNQGFLAEPYVSKVHSVGAGDTLLLISASDGLWDVTNANIVMRIAHRVLEEEPGDVCLVGKVLLEHALERRSKDDITISVLLVAGAVPGSNGRRSEERAPTG